MLHKKIFPLFLFLITAITVAQNKEITLEEIFKGTFRTQRMDVLHSMKNGKQYSVLNFDRTSRTSSIDIYDYKTLEKVKTVVNSDSLEAIKHFSKYIFIAFIFVSSS